MTTRALTRAETNEIDSPRNNDHVECCNVDTAGHPVLDFAMGHATTTQAVVAVRARVNGGPWQQPGLVFCDELDPAGYSTYWEIAGISTVSLTGANTLEAEVQLEDGTWVPAPSIQFTAFCGQQPEPPMRMAAVNFYVQLPEQDPPTTAWALLTSKLAVSQAVKLKRVRVQSKASVLFVWESAERPKPIWKLTLLNNRIAELTMRLPVRRSGRRATLEQRWVSGKFSPRTGGYFLPTGDNLVIRSILEVRKTKDG